MRSKDMLCMGLVNDSEQKMTAATFAQISLIHGVFISVITTAPKSNYTLHQHFLPSVQNLANGVFKT
jgi:hypothetical protein